DEDRVLSGWLDHDRGNAAGLSRHAPDMARVDPKSVEIIDGGVREHVIADGCDHHHGGAKLGRGRSLIGPLAAMSHLEARRLDGLPLDRHAIHISDKVHHVASDDGDARLVHLGHCPCLSMFAPAGSSPRSLLAEVAFAFSRCTPPARTSPSQIAYPC